MAKIERILILAKTYPSPSAQYVETSCVAGINEQGEMRRIYPMPFRYIEQSQQFKKWQWVEARVRKSKNDHRFESYRIDVDTIKCGDSIDTKNGWACRREWINKLPTFDNFDAIENRRLAGNGSLALLTPKKISGLEIIKSRNPDWTVEEKEKLLREQMQGNIFNEADAKQQVRNLRKIPFDFYYRYICATSNGEQEFRHKIVDWEAGALFWKCHSDYGNGWEAPFRAKLETELGAKDLMFLMGNQHRFQDQWLIISLIYPPKQNPTQAMQYSLF